MSGIFSKRHEFLLGIVKSLFRIQFQLNHVQPEACSNTFGISLGSKYKSISKYIFKAKQLSSRTTIILLWSKHNAKRTKKVRVNPFMYAIVDAEFFILFVLRLDHNKTIVFGDLLFCY